MKILYTLLISLLLLAGCSETETEVTDTSKSSSENTKLTIPAGTKSANGLFTIGDKKELIAGENITLEVNKLDTSKEFVSYEWLENGDIIGSDEKLILTDLPIGTHYIVCQMRDKEGNIFADIVTINVKFDDNTNHPPVAESFNLTLDEDTPVITHLRGSDEDGDALTYSYIKTPTKGTLSGSTVHLKYTPKPNATGSDSFTYVSNDGHSNSKVATVNIDIKPINDAPVFKTEPSKQIVIVGDTLSLDVDIIDLDGDDLSFKVTPSWISFKDGKLYISPQDKDIGKEHVILTADDNHGKLASFEFDLNIIKESIHIKKIAPIIISEDDKNHIIELHIDNEDNSIPPLYNEKQIIYTISNYQNIFVHNKSNKFSLDLSKYQYLKEDQNVTFTIKVKASVNGLIDDSTDFNITILGKNDTTKFGNNYYPDAIEDEPYNIDIVKELNITDADNNPNDFNITAKDLPTWIKIENGKFIGTPTNDDVEVNKKITLHLNDNITYSTFINVINTNDKPIANPDEYHISEDKNIIIMYVLDNDIEIDKNDSCEISDLNITNTDENITLDATKKYIYVTLNNDYDYLKEGEVKDINFSYKIVDNLGASSDYTSVTLHIIGKNNTPVTNIYKPFPKTGDTDDGDFGSDRNFTRDDTTNIVTDNVTNLMWQDDDSISNQEEISFDEAYKNCQDLTLGDYNDWRVPNRLELYMLASKTKGNKGFFIDDTFMNMGENISLKILFFENISFLAYWSSQKKSDESGRYLNFIYATDDISINRKNYVRCVRGDELNVTLEDDGSVILDKEHKLMWDTSAETRTLTKNWSEGIAYCTSLDRAGYTDWRVPNIYELYSITSVNGMIEPFLELNSTDTWWWSATTFEDYESKAYAVDLNSGYDSYQNKQNENIIRCVRSIE